MFYYCVFEASTVVVASDDDSTVVVVDSEDASAMDAVSEDSSSVILDLVVSELTKEV